MNYKYLVTIFTPTYNRARLLKRLYESLKEQSDKDFEWIIVDDGSKDNTKEVVQGFIKEKIIPIKYLKKENEGTRIHSSAYGVFCFSVGIDKVKAMEGYLYAYVSASIINAVKLIPLSQNEGQKILYKCYKFFDEIIDMLLSLDIKDLCLSTPGFDIRCMQHEALYSRLYMS